MPRFSPGRLAAAGLSIGLSLAGGTALAEKPKILALPYQGMNAGVTAEFAEQATVIVTEELGASGLTIIRADDIADVKAPAETAAPKPPAGGDAAHDAPTGDPLAGEKANELISRAKNAMEDEDAEPALKQLKKAVRMLEDNGDAVPDLRVLAEAYLQLGVAAFRAGNEEEADEALSKAVHFAPDKDLDAATYPPLFIRVYERARFYVLQRPRGAIEVKAAAGAQVLFDGRNLGKAPLNINEVLPGTHWIRIERPGEPVSVKKVSIRAKRTILVEFAGAGEAAAPAEEPTGGPAGVLGAVARNEVSKAHVAQLQAAGKKHGADYVMFGAIYKTETAYNIYTAFVSVQDGSVGRLVDIAFDLDLLSAQIEVYKIAENAKRQAETRKLENVDKEPVFVPAPKISLKAKAPKAVVKQETKVSTVVGAPPPIAAPKAPNVAAAEEGGRAPLAGAGEAGAVTVAGAVKPAVAQSSVVPKDEIAAGPASASPSSSAAATSLSPQTSVVVAAGGEDRPEESGSLWWVWLIVGVAAAGGAAAGGYFLVSSRSSDEATVRVQWPSQ